MHALFASTALGMDNGAPRRLVPFQCMGIPCSSKLTTVHVMLQHPEDHYFSCALTLLGGRIAPEDVAESHFGHERVQLRAPSVGLHGFNKVYNKWYDEMAEWCPDAAAIRHILCDAPGQRCAKSSNRSRST